jgi:hypothetical protein
MAAKRKPRPRAIPPGYATWAQREAVAERAGVEYVADLDGIPPHASGPWIIRRRTAGKKIIEWEIVDRAPGAHKSEVDDRVAVLNRGNPTVGENRSWGTLKKSAVRREPGRVHKNLSGLSVTQWVERLYTDGETSAVLRDYVASKRSLTFETLRTLLLSVGTPDEEFTDELLDAISKQLDRKFQVRRKQRR